ncbi:hypothetical protein B0H10DRAFT_977544 [Mycena sp. CBHHK59/15]|nr:hypothetical protein B0H10DRAFT_977544 [Mycena sp. CBHHK59/15]
MVLTTLIHRGLEVWLADSKGHIIPLGSATLLAENQISTAVQVQRGTKYCVFWRSSQGSTLTALCEIFVLHQGEHFSVATDFMDAEKPLTQFRTSKGRLLDSFDDGEWLKSPPATKKGYVSLEVRRGTGTPKLVSNLDPDDLDKRLDEINIDLIDDDEKGHPPFIIFRFEFVGLPKPARPSKIVGPSKSAAAKPSVSSAGSISKPPEAARVIHFCPGLPSGSTIPQKRKSPESEQQSPKNTVTRPESASNSVRTRGIFPPSVTASSSRDPSRDESRISPNTNMKDTIASTVYDDVHFERQRQLARIAEKRRKLLSKKEEEKEVNAKVQKQLLAEEEELDAELAATDKRIAQDREFLRG